MIAAIAVSIAAAGAGCGGGDSSPESKYAAQLKDASGPIFDAFGTIASDVDPGNSDADNVAALSSAKANLRDGTDAIAALNPPPGVTDAHDTLVGALRDFERQVSDARSAIQAGDPNAVDDFEAQATTFADTLQGIKQQLSDAGVKLGG